MQYIISFLEGIITFISPCLLPMLPIYISYFAGGGERSGRKTLTGALGFVLGFTVVFVAMGALAGTLGGLPMKYQRVVNIVSGAVVIFFGLNFLGVFKLKLFTGGGHCVNTRDMGSADEAQDGYHIRRLSVENNVTLFSALDTVRVLLDVLEETTFSISTIDA